MKNLRLKSARAALDLSQQQLAEKVGVSRQTINAIEKGDYNPTIKLCQAEQFSAWRRCYFLSQVRLDKIKQSVLYNYFAVFYNDIIKSKGLII